MSKQFKAVKKVVPPGVKETKCGCPFCPLVENNIQVCDIRITLTKDTWRCETDDERTKTLVDPKHFLTIALFAKNNCMLRKRNTTIDLSQENKYECFVTCLNKMSYKICFHNKTVA